jgi:hypothetical protein
MERQPFGEPSDIAAWLSKLLAFLRFVLSSSELKLSATIHDSHFLFFNRCWLAPDHVESAGGIGGGSSHSTGIETHHDVS